MGAKIVFGHLEFDEKHNMRCQQRYIAQWQKVTRPDGTTVVRPVCIYPPEFATHTIKWD